MARQQYSYEKRKREIEKKKKKEEKLQRKVEKKKSTQTPEADTGEDSDVSA